jgi:hypothetical protein
VSRWSVSSSTTTASDGARDCIGLSPVALKAD